MHHRVIVFAFVNNSGSLYFQDSVFDAQFQPDVNWKSTSASSNIKKASSSSNFADDLSSIFAGRTL
jgi:hypothetical protein